MPEYHTERTFTQPCRPLGWNDPPPRTVVIVGLEFRRNGRRVSEREFWKGIKSDTAKALTDEAEKRIRRVRCPVHHTGPTGLRRATRMGRVEWTYSMCCEVGKAAVRRAL